jgi:hypothetical protein
MYYHVLAPVLVLGLVLTFSRTDGIDLAFFQHSQHSQPEPFSSSICTSGKC